MVLTAVMAIFGVAGSALAKNEKSTRKPTNSSETCSELERLRELANVANGDAWFAQSDLRFPAKVKGQGQNRVRYASFEKADGIVQTRYRDRMGDSKCGGFLKVRGRFAAIRGIRDNAWDTDMAMALRKLMKKEGDGGITAIVSAQWDGTGVDPEVCSIYYYDVYADGCVLHLDYDTSD